MTDSFFWAFFFLLLFQIILCRPIYILEMITKMTLYSKLKKVVDSDQCLICEWFILLNKSFQWVSWFSSQNQSQRFNPKLDWSGFRDQEIHVYLPSSGLSWKLQIILSHFCIFAHGQSDLQRVITRTYIVRVGFTENCILFCQDS